MFIALRVCKRLKAGLSRSLICQ